MIECEFYCIKRGGKAARFRIFLKITEEIINICTRCLEGLNPNDYKILEDYQK